MGKVVAQERDAFGVQFVNAAGAVATVAHQTGLFQCAKMLRNRRTRNGQSRSQLMHCAWVGTQHLENGEAGGVTKGAQSGLYVSIHLR